MDVAVPALAKLFRGLRHESELLEQASRGGVIVRNADPNAVGRVAVEDRIHQRNNRGRAVAVVPQLLLADQDRQLSAAAPVVYHEALADVPAVLGIDR